MNAVHIELLFALVIAPLASAGDGGYSPEEGVGRKLFPDHHRAVELIKYLANGYRPTDVITDILKRIASK